MKLFYINVGNTEYTVKHIDDSFYIMEGFVLLTILTFEQGKWHSSVPTMSPKLTEKLGRSINHYYGL